MTTPAAYRLSDTTTITVIRLLDGSELASCIDATSRYNAWDYARRVIADWADCSLSRVAFEEADLGEFATVDGEQVAWIVTKREPSPRLHTLTVNLRPMLARA